LLKEGNLWIIRTGATLRPPGPGELRRSPSREKDKDKDRDKDTRDFA
jgi:hypothetical protein